MNRPLNFDHWHVSVRDSAMVYSKCPKKRGRRNGMVIAHPYGDCFCANATRRNLGTWLTKGGERNALDDICNLVGPVVTRRSEQLHDWWVHPSLIGVSTRGATY